LNWLDLNTTVLDSLGELDSAYRTLRQRYAANVATLARQSANLQSNMRYLQPCASPGTWSGAGTDVEVKFTGTECDTTFRLTGVVISITVGTDSRITRGTIDFIQGSRSCLGDGPAVPLSAYVTAGSISGDTITATFSSSEDFRGNIRNGRLNGTLIFHVFRNATSQVAREFTNNSFNSSARN